VRGRDKPPIFQRINDGKIIFVNNLVKNILFSFYYCSSTYLVPAACSLHRVEVVDYSITAVYTDITATRSVRHNARTDQRDKNSDYANKARGQHFIEEEKNKVYY
jgi:hypothetical protein